MAAHQYELDYFRHLLTTLDAGQLEGEDILRMLELIRDAIDRE